MNPTEPQRPAAPRRHVWRWVGGLAAGCLLIVAIGIYNLVTLSRDAAALRQELFSALDLRASPKVQISVGPGLLAVARLGMTFVDSVPPEAREALKAIKAASVGVYQLRENLPSEGRAKLFAAADGLMKRRDWIRVVGVNNDHETVLIYMPANSRNRDVLRVCLAVCQRDQVVVVSAVAEGEALIELARDHRRLAGI